MDDMILPYDTRRQDFPDLFARADLFTQRDKWEARLHAVSGQDVERILSQTPGRYHPDRLMALMSPAAQNYLEMMAQQAHTLTTQRFGKTITLFAPLYVSNYCCNRCTYCGFSSDNLIKRRRLSIDEVMAEAMIIRAEGFTDLLLVSGEDRSVVTVDYLVDLAEQLRTHFSTLSIETHQLDKDEYQEVFAAGIDGVTLYQETYDPEAYARFHLSGPKADFEHRLKAPDHFASAGMRRLGLGALLGLSPNWRLEVLALGMHGHYLMRKYWQSQISFSFPRLRPAQEVGDETFDHPLHDKDLVQMILALRLCFSDAGLVLSTREAPRFRNALVKLGITRMSAGSKTNPGGYAVDAGSLEQFAIDDDRSAAQIAEMLKHQGLEPVWKDWDAAFNYSCA
jgi:2-iminoacetate synthase